MLTQLALTHVRNIFEAKITLQENFNLFFGENGSGKTSILEAAYILGIGRSFRHHQLDSVIMTSADNLCIVGWLNEGAQAQVVGVEKSRSVKLHARKNGSAVASIAALATCLPLQLIHPTSEELIQGGPKLRRQFMDWGLFHVEHGFLDSWQRLQRLLKQRNAALKMQQPISAIQCWDEEFCAVAHQISAWREQSVLRIQQHFYPILLQLWPEAEISLHYKRGWPTDHSLLALLQRQLSRDLHTGYTGYGPHRDELVILCKQQPAAQILSRGEQKLVVIALRLALGELLKSCTGKSGIFLLDDIGAELDRPHRRAVGKILHQLAAQVLLTTIDPQEIIADMALEEAKLFHVEHGAIHPV